MPLDGAENVGRNVLGSVPMPFVPRLQQADLGTTNLNVQLDVSVEAGMGEV